MEHTTVVRALVLAGAVFFFKNANRCAWFAKQQLAGDSETHDSTADDEMVVLFQILEPRSHSVSSTKSASRVRRGRP